MSSRRILREMQGARSEAKPPRTSCTQGKPSEQQRSYSRKGQAQSRRTFREEQGARNEVKSPRTPCTQGKPSEQQRGRSRKRQASLGV